MSDKQAKVNPKVEWGYFAVTPRILRTKYKQLSHTEKWLYTCLKDLCGDKGMCFRTLRVLSQETDLSIGNLSIGIRHLHEAGLIHAEKKRRSANPTAKEVWHISIVDIWKSNVEYCSNYEHSAENVQEMNNNVHNLNNPSLERSISEQKRSNFDDRRITPEEQQFEERTVEEEESVSADASRTNETSYHIADGAIGNEEDEKPTEKRVAIPGKLTLPSKVTANTPPRASSHETGSYPPQVPSMETAGARGEQQTPGPGALPPSVDPPVDGSRGITRDQAIPSLLLDPEPVQAALPPGPAQATGKPEKPKRGRKSEAQLTLHEQEIKEWYEELRGVEISLSKRTVMALASLGKRKMSKDDFLSVTAILDSDKWFEEHKIGVDLYWIERQWENKIIFLRRKNSKRYADTDDIADDDYSIAAMLKIQERRERREAERGVTNG